MSYRSARMLRASWVFALLFLLAGGLSWLSCSEKSAHADTLPSASSPAAGTLKASPNGKALCPFAVKNSSGTTLATVDCNGNWQLPANDSICLSGTLSNCVRFDSTYGLGAFSGIPPAGRTNWGVLHLYVNNAAGSDAITVENNGERIHFGAGASDYASSDGTTVTFAGPQASTKYTSNAASTTDAFAVATSGARIHFGAGILDYASSDGTTVTFASPLAANGFAASGSKITAVANGTASADAATFGQLPDTVFGAYAPAGAPAGATVPLASYQSHKAPGHIYKITATKVVAGSGCSGNLTVAAGDVNNSGTTLCSGSATATGAAGSVYNIDCASAAIAGGVEPDVFLATGTAACTTWPTWNVTVTVGP